MKTNRLAISIGIASTLTIGVIVYAYFLKRNREEQRLISIADAGYETAHDILYPLKSRRLKRL